jgi:DNA-binding SARP family transcriptional activator
VFYGEQPITEWNGLKGKSILKYLLMHRETPVVKDILMDLFWPDATSESARRNLHQAIYSLRQTLRHADPGFSPIQFESDSYFVHPEMDIWIDSQEFERHVQAGKRLESAGRTLESVSHYGVAESLYQGVFLEEDLYEDWTMARRERLRRMYCDLADRLGRYYVQNGEYSAAVSLCHKALAQDKCHEPAHRRLMRCYWAQGQRHLAVRQYLACVGVLEEELSLGPSQETEALYRRITGDM